MAEREFYYLRWFTCSSWNIILRQESLHLERLLVSEALLSNEASRASHRYVRDLALRRLNQRLLWEQDDDFGVVCEVDGVLRNYFEGYFRSLLNDLNISICCGLYCTSLRRKSDLIVNHSDIVIILGRYLDPERVGCLFVVGLAQAINLDRSLLFVLKVVLADSGQNKRPFTVEGS